MSQAYSLISCLPYVYSQVAVERIMFGIFSTISTIMLLNFAICTLNASMEAVKSAEMRALRKMKKVGFGQAQHATSAGETGQRDEIDREVGSFVFEKLSSFFTSCSSKKNLPSVEPRGKQMFTASTHKKC